MSSSSSSFLNPLQISPFYCSQPPQTALQPPAINPKTLYYYYPHRKIIIIFIFFHQNQELLNVEDKHAQNLPGKMENYYQNQPEKVTRPPPVKSRLRLRTTGGGGEIVEVQGGHIVRATGRKDRHSKVCTAKGPKDRRVRLSAHTAIQFYDVQDRLGYDRPSTAVDWLITKAKSAIDELAELPPWKPANLEPNPNQENVNCSELRRFDELPDDEIVDTQMGNVQNSIFLPDSIKSFFPMGGCSTPANNDNYSWPETGGFQSGFVFSSSPMQTTPFLQTQTTNSQLLNYVSQRGTLQSNNTPPVRAWVDPFSGSGIDQHQTLAFHYPSLMPGFTSGLNRFSGFRIPAQIQGEEEEHDGISDKPSSASYDSRP